MNQLNAERTEQRNAWSEPNRGRRLPISDSYNRPYAPRYETLHTGSAVGGGASGTVRLKQDDDASQFAVRRWLAFYLQQGFSIRESVVLAKQICASEHGRNGALPFDNTRRESTVLSGARSILAIPNRATP